MKPRCPKTWAVSMLLLGACAPAPRARVAAPSRPVLGAPSLDASDVWDATYDVSTDTLPDTVTEEAAPPPPPTGCLRMRATDHADGRALPVRLHVQGVAGTPDPELGPPESARGARAVAIAVGGAAELTLPVGRYRVTLSHGPEWSVERRPAEVTEGPCTEVSAQLSEVVPMDDWTACDLHVHARPSYDSRVTPEDRVAQLVAEGVEFAVPSEHDHVGDYGPAVAALPPGGPGLAWTPAVEVTTERFGHFNVYPFVPVAGAPRGGPPSHDLPPAELFRLAHANNPQAVVQVNHPRMGTMGYFNRVRFNAVTGRGTRLYDAHFDALELFNGFHLGALQRDELVFRDWLTLLGRGVVYVGTASSDSHEVAWRSGGYPRTYVYTPGAGRRSPSPAVLLRALRQGQAFGTSGPMLLPSIGGAVPGSVTRTRRPWVELRIRVLAAPWVDVDQVELYRNGALLQTIPVPPSTAAERLDARVRVPLATRRDSLVLFARGDATLDLVLPHLRAVPFAFTNPLWVERARPGAARGPGPRTPPRR
ncbi:MAG: CehA/McbA family metallohydrolase [Deltaproteobacteria bacterium]|nr:CehA/McbA family metallohydrolase [Deltaproteobacteria bacterium]